LGVGFWGGGPWNVSRGLGERLEKSKMFSTDTEIVIGAKKKKKNKGGTALEKETLKSKDQFQKKKVVRENKNGKSLRFYLEWMVGGYCRVLKKKESKKGDQKEGGPAWFHQKGVLGLSFSRQKKRVSRERKTTMGKKKKQTFQMKGGVMVMVFGQYRKSYWNVLKKTQKGKKCWPRTELPLRGCSATRGTVQLVVRGGADCLCAGVQDEKKRGYGLWVPALQMSVEPVPDSKKASQTKKRDLVKNRGRSGPGTTPVSAPKRPKGTPIGDRFEFGRVTHNDKRTAQRFYPCVRAWALCWGYGGAGGGENNHMSGGATSANGRRG